MLPTRPISASWYTSERLQIAECPPLVAVSLYFSREERVPHLNATLMELKLVCGRR